MKNVVEDLTPLYTAIAVLLGILGTIIIGNHFREKGRKDTQKILNNQNKIIALISKQDISEQFNKIIEVNEGIIDNLEDLSKYAKEGETLLIKGKSSAYDVTLSSNEHLELNGDFTFDHSDDWIQLIRISGKWKELSKTNNA